jgi:hypothetical protein
VTNSLGIPRLLFADDFSIESFRSYELQKKFKLVYKYCKNRNLKCNLSNSKITVFKKEDKLKATESWRMNRQNFGVVDNLIN